MTTGIAAQRSLPARPRLLFTGGGGAGTEALARLLESRYEVHFADADVDARPWSLDASRWHRIPLANDPGFVDGITALCEQLGIDLLIPTVDEELPALARLGDSRRFAVLLPDPAFVDTHLDKYTSNRSLCEAGLPAPLTELGDRRALVDFPCIAKPRHGRGSRNVAVVGSAAEWDAHLLLARVPAGEFVAQELLRGQEFTVMMLADRSTRLRAVVPVLVERKRGITLRAVTSADAAVIAGCAAIHHANPVAGCYNIQLIRTEAGEIKPFEINPRISTTACLGLAAGVDFVGVFLGAAAAGDAELLPFTPGLRLRRAWHNEFCAPGA